MKSSKMGWLATGAVVGFVGALVAGVPASTIAPLLFLVACPLMMYVMMRGMHDQQGSDTGHSNEPIHH